MTRNVTCKKFSNKKSCNKNKELSKKNRNGKNEFERMV